MSIKALIEQRFSCNYFDASFSLSDQQIAELVSLATRAPSAYNGQNWRFIAVRTPEARQAMVQIACGQQKVADAAVCFILCGRLDLHTQLAQTLAPSCAAGILTPDLLQTMVHYATEAYQDQPGLQRDEAIRSASLAGMTLMLAAQGMGLASCPMIGFDTAELARHFGLGAADIPVMLIAVGKAAGPNWPQKPRKPLAGVLEFV